MTTLHTIDDNQVARRARQMTVEALRWSADDAADAATRADAMERAGFRVQKTGGYYRDEAAAYRTELRRRGY